MRSAFVGYPATEALVATAFASHRQGNVMRKVFIATSALVVVSSVLQLYFAALGHFSTRHEDLFGPHTVNGRVVLPILVILNIVAAAVARAGSRTIWLTVLLFGLLVLQTLIFLITIAIFNVTLEGEVVPVGASILLGLHGLNGFAIIALSGTLLGRAIRLSRGELPPRREEPARVTADAAH